MSVKCPSWFWILLGIFLVRAVPSAPLRQIAEADLHNRLPYMDSGLEHVNPETLSTRELRRIPGVGQVRALAIARERWRSERAGEEFVLLDVSGIGPSIAGQIRAWKADPPP